MSEWKPGIIAGLFIAALAAGGTYQHEHQQVQAARDQTEAARDELAISKKNAETLTGQLQAQKEELITAQAQLQGESTARRSAARQLLAGAESDSARREILRDFASELRVRASRPQGLADFYTPTTTGLAEDLILLSKASREYPVILDLSGTDLHGTYLRKESFVNVILARTDLRAVDFSGADLRSASFVGADLTCGTLRGATLGDSDFTDVHLEWADVRGTDLGSVSGMTSTQLKGASYDDQTVFPESVAVGELGPSRRYTSPRDCASKHFKVPATPSPSPSQSSTPTTTSDTQSTGGATTTGATTQ